MIREEAFENEEEAALASITKTPERPGAMLAGWPTPLSIVSQGASQNGQARESSFFRRKTLADVVG